MDTFGKDKVDRFANMLAWQKVHTESRQTSERKPPQLDGSHLQPTSSIQHSLHNVQESQHSRQQIPPPAKDRTAQKQQADMDNSRVQQIVDQIFLQEQSQPPEAKYTPLKLNNPSVFKKVMDQLQVLETSPVHNLNRVHSHDKHPLPALETPLPEKTGKESRVVDYRREFNLRTPQPHHPAVQYTPLTIQSVKNPHIPQCDLSKKSFDQTVMSEKITTGTPAPIKHSQEGSFYTIKSQNITDNHNNARNVGRSLLPHSLCTHLADVQDFLAKDSVKELPDLLKVCAPSNAHALSLMIHFLDHVLEKNYQRSLEKINSKQKFLDFLESHSIFQQETQSRALADFFYADSPDLSLALLCESVERYHLAKTDILLANINLLNRFVSAVRERDCFEQLFDAVELRSKQHIKVATFKSALTSLGVALEPSDLKKLVALFQHRDALLTASLVNFLLISKQLSAFCLNEQQFVSLSKATLKNNAVQTLLSATAICDQIYDQFVEKFSHFQLNCRSQGNDPLGPIAFAQNLRLHSTSESTFIENIFVFFKVMGDPSGNDSYSGSHHMSLNNFQKELKQKMIENDLKEIEDINEILNP